MAKGEDALLKKRNKGIRKRMRKDLSNSTEFINGLIAAKRRRKAGRRRICEGMCYSLPTPEDPFNERSKYRSCKKQWNNKREPSEAAMAEQSLSGSMSAVTQRRPFVQDKVNDLSQKSMERKKTVKGNSQTTLLPKPLSQPDKILKPTDHVKDSTQNDNKRTGVLTSSFVLGRNVTLGTVFELSLDAIMQTIFQDGPEQAGLGKLPSDNKWGTKFWEACSKGSNVLGISGTTFDYDQAASVVSAAASHVTEKRMRNSFNSNPVVLFIVASQEQALKVRMVCKPLRKVLGIHSVSLHPGALLDHQIQGLRICIPEILVSTPERLLELLVLKALDISSISLLVIYGLKSIVDGDFVDSMKSVRSQICGNPQTVVLSDTFAGVPTALVQQLLKAPIQRVSFDSCVANESICITQSVFVFTSEEKKLKKALKILRQACENQRSDLLDRIVIIVDTAVNTGKTEQVVAALESEGYLVNIVIDDLKNHGKIPGDGSVNTSRNKLHVLVTTERLLDQSTLSEVQVVIIYDFPSSLQTYTKVLTTMGRFSPSSFLYSFCSGVDAPLAGQLIHLLEQCSQPVPHTLNMLSLAASVIKH